MTRNFDYWQKQNVPSVPNPVPGFGHMMPMIFLKENLAEWAYRMYKETKSSIIGFYFLQTPGVIIRDLDLVKCVLQTNFSSFRHNIMKTSEKADPIMSKNPFFTEDHHLWKTARARTTAHLSGRKLRLLLIIVQEVCEKMSNYIDQKIKEDGEFFECGLKEFFFKCTGEVVANAAFAIQGQSYNDDPDKMAFTNAAKNIFGGGIINGLKQALLFYLPGVADFLEISVLEKRSENFFKQTAKAIIEKRKKENMTSNDYLQFCMDLNGEDIDSIVADLVIFYGDVYETSSTTMAFVLYQLSKNREVQEKLREDIFDVIKSTGDKITYESLKAMTYLDQVKKESMRLLMPLGVLMKECTEEITLVGSDGVKCTMKPGDKVLIPAMGFNNDSQYYSDPEVFDPERFSPENVAQRHRFLFLPFGEGPRMCIGMCAFYYFSHTHLKSCIHTINNINSNLKHS